MKFSTITTMKFGTFVLFAATFASPALAGQGKSQDPSKTGRQGHGAYFFQKMDADGDGAISKSEARDAAGQIFTAVDKNGDDVVTKEEAQAHRALRRQAHRRGRAGAPPNGKMAEQRFQRMDKDGDGEIDREESRMPEKMFDRMDTNDDDSVSIEEYRAHLEARRERRAQRGATRFAQMDEDGDGEISRDEAEAASDRFFEEMDRDQDDRVTQEEARRAMKKHHKARGRKGKKACAENSQ